MTESPQNPPQDKTPERKDLPPVLTIPKIKIEARTDLESLRTMLDVPPFKSLITTDDVPPPPAPEKPKENLSIGDRIEILRRRYGVEILFGSMTKGEKRVLNGLDAERSIESPKDQSRILNLMETVLADLGPECFEVLLTPQLFYVPGKNGGEKTKEMKPYSYRLKFVDGLFKGTTPTGGGTAGSSLECISVVNVRSSDLETDGAVVLKRVLHEMQHFFYHHASGKDRFRKSNWQRIDEYKALNAQIGVRYLDDNDRQASTRSAWVNKDLKKRTPYRSEIVNDPRRPKGFASIEAQLDPEEDGCETGARLWLQAWEDWSRIQREDPVLTKKLQERMEYFEDLSAGRMNKAYFEGIFRRNSKKGETLVRN